MLIKIEDVQFLLKELQLSDDLKNALTDFLESSEPLSVAKVEELRGLCTEKLASLGFDQKYKPNQLGRRLEELIDKLFMG